MRVGAEYMIISTHVDDFGVAATSHALIDTVYAQLSAIYDLVAVPDMTYYLGQARRFTFHNLHTSRS
jgi:hypothetical protein